MRRTPVTIVTGRTGRAAGYDERSARLPARQSAYLAPRRGTTVALVLEDDTGPIEPAANRAAHPSGAFSYAPIKTMRSTPLSTAMIAAICLRNGITEHVDSQSSANAD